MRLGIGKASLPKKEKKYCQLKSAHAQLKLMKNVKYFEHSLSQKRLNIGSLYNWSPV